MNRSTSWIAVAAIALVLACSGSDAAEPTSAPASGLVQTQPDIGRDHVQVGILVGDYTTRPATSGPHWPVVGPSPLVPSGVPARWGIYGFELPDEVLVHNLEHGGIGLHYNCPEGCSEIVDALASLAPSNFSQFLIAPYSNMNSKIAVTTWRHILYLDEVNTARIQRFIDEYRDKAPESVPGNMF